MDVPVTSASRRSATSKLYRIGEPAVLSPPANIPADLVSIPIDDTSIGEMYSLCIVSHLSLVESILHWKLIGSLHQADFGDFGLE